MSDGRAVDEVDEAVRNAGIDEAAHQFGAGARRVLGALDDDRAARGKRAGELAHRLVDGEVPRGEGRDRPDRLADDDLQHAGGARRHDAAVGAAALLGAPVDVVGGAEDFRLGLGQRLAFLHGEGARDRVDALAQQLGGLAHELVALEGGRLAPGAEGPGGGFRGALQVGFLGNCELADLGAGGGVENGHGLPALAGAPGAVDQQAYVVIHGRTP
jgi:hypothetical protein